MTVKAVAATGQVGTGFLAESLRTAAAGADFLGCDGGSSDPGPYYLGSGRTQAADQALERDVTVMLSVAVEAGIPMIIGSAGTAGATPHVRRISRMVTAAAQRQGRHVEMATISSDVAPETIARAWRDGRITPLPGAPELTAERILGCTRIVAMMGVQPIQRALRRGAQVVVAGRASDVSIFAALPLLRGIPAGVAYHAGKVLECGASSVARKLYPDSMCAQLDDDGFVLEPPNPAFACTPQSVASHSLYENADPFRLVEPGGTLDMRDARYTAVSDRAVRVTGSRFEPTDDHTVRLEAATLAGYRTVAFAGVRDPLVIRQLDAFLADATATVERKVQDSLSLQPDRYRLSWRVYGGNGVLGPIEPTPAPGHEVGLLLDVVADSQEQASAIAAVGWHTTLHHPIPEYSGGVSHLAFPFSPPTAEAGPVYEFAINHVWHLDDPCEPFTDAYTTL